MEKSELMIADMKRTIKQIRATNPETIGNACDYLNDMIDRLVTTLKEEYH